jgi:hypothetical protein
MANGDEKAWNLKVKLSSTAKVGSTIVNVAVATSSVPDPSVESSRDSLRTRVTPIVNAGGGARLGVSISTPKRTLRAGERYLIGVSVTVLRRSRSKSAGNTRLCVTLPANVGYLSSNGLRRPGRQVCWKIGTLTRGKVVRFEIKARAARPGLAVVRAAANADNALAVTASSPVRHAVSFTG